MSVEGDIYFSTLHGGVELLANPLTLLPPQFIRVCPALVVLLDLLDLVDPLEMLVVLASLDPLVSGLVYWPSSQKSSVLCLSFFYTLLVLG